MIDDAGADESVAVAIEVYSPGIARAIGEDLDFFCSRMISRDRGIDFNPIIIGVVRILDLRIREDSVSHVEPAVGSPGEAVEQFVAILQAEAGLENSPLIGFVIPIRILKKEEVRSLADVNATVADENAGEKIEPVGKDGDLVGPAIGVGVFKDFDAITRFLAGFGTQWIFVE